MRTRARLAHAPFAHGYLIDDVSCPSASLCAAGDSVGNIFATTDPGATSATWTATDIAPGKQIEFLTCQSSTFCLAEIPAGGERLQIFTSTSPAGGPSAWVAATNPRAGRQDLVPEPQALRDRCPR
jgi:hypothetical protein